MAKRIKLGILGGGGESLIGVLHRVAAYMYDEYEISGGVFTTDLERSIAFAEDIDIPTDRIYPDLDTLIARENELPSDQRMEAVAVLTPNFLHFPMAKQLLEAGYHVICEKPLTTTYEEAKTLADVYKRSGKVFAVTHTYTGYPMVREMRELVAEGALGKVHKVDVQYYQGWINDVIHDEEKRKQVWRLDPAKAGISSCMGDIGVHAFNMLEYTTGLQVSSLLADFNYLYDDNEMDVDGTVLLRMGKHVKGVLRSSQVATGEENGLSIRIYGEKAGLFWEQENPNYLYLKSDTDPLRVLKPGHAYNSKLSLDGTKLPPGHPEGIFDAMGNIYKGAARAIRGETYNPGEFPTLDDGVRGMNFIEATVESNSRGNIWVALNS